MAKKTELTPEHEDLHKLVVATMLDWRGPGLMPPHMVAHQDPGTGMLTFHIRGFPAQLEYIAAALRAYRG